MMDRICLLTLILFSFIRAGGVQAAPSPKSFAGAGSSRGIKTTSHPEVNPGHSASSSKPAAPASTQYAPSRSTSAPPHSTLLKTTAGAHNSANPDQHLVSTSSASGVGSSTSRIASTSTSCPSDHSTLAPPQSTLSGAHNFANPDQHLVSTSSTSGVGSSTLSHTASASASRSSSFETKSNSAAAQSSSVARSISASHSRSNTASPSLASSSSAKYRPSGSLSASSDFFGPISSSGQSQSYSSLITAARSNSSKTFIAIQSSATVSIPAIHPAVVATHTGVQPQGSSTISAAPTPTAMRPTEILTTVDPPSPHVIEPSATYIGAPHTESIAIPAAAIPTVVQPKDSPTIPAALIPGVMRPAETMTFASMNPPPTHVMQSPGAVITTWDPMPTVWEAGGNGYTYVDSSSMMHDGGIETEYYVPADAYMTESMSDPGAASMMDGPLTTTVYGIRIGASVAATLSSSTMVFTTISYSAFTSNSHTFTTSFPITSTAITLVPVPTAMGVAPLSGSAKSPRNTALIVGLAVPFSALLIAGITGLILWCRRRRLVQQQQILESEATFFPARLVSQPSSVRSLSVYSDVNADELDLARPPLQASSMRLSSFLTPGVSLRDALALRPTTPVQGEYLASCQASIVDPSPHSPASSSGSSAARQEQLASEVIMVREEISALEKRASARRDVKEEEEDAVLADEGRRREEC